MKAVFLDRDGVVCEDSEASITRIEDVRMIDGAAEAVRLLAENGFLVFIITNQPAIAKGLVLKSDAEKINHKIKSDLEEKGGKIRAVYMCPHHPEKGWPGEVPELKIDCGCRKPKTGLVDMARKEFEIDIKNSWFVGDQTMDVQCGKNAGCKTILVKTGAGGSDRKYAAEPDYVCENVLESAKLICNSDVKAVIVCGGLGTRMRSLSKDIPKALFPIAGKPVLQHQIEWLKRNGIRNFVFCIGHLGEQIKEFIGSSEFGIVAHYAEEKTPLGTGGAIRNASAFLDGTFLLVYGDIMSDIDVSKLIKFHKDRHSLVTIVVHKTDHPWDSELVVLGSDSRIAEIIMRPDKMDNYPSTLSKSSVYVVEKEALDLIPEGKCDFEKDVLHPNVRQQKFFGYLTEEFAKDVGTPERYEAAKKRVIELP